VFDEAALRRNLAVIDRRRYESGAEDVSDRSKIQF
jgi:hypothetical protein